MSPPGRADGTARRLVGSRTTGHPSWSRSRLGFRQVSKILQSRSRSCSRVASWRTAHAGDGRRTGSTAASPGVARCCPMGQGRADAVTEPTTGPRLRPGAGQLDTIIEIATWFYVHGWSQVRIAHALDLDPSTVSRYLKRARDEAIVRIEIRRPADPDLHLARRLTEHVGISRSIVVPEGDHPLEAVAAAACRAPRRPARHGHAPGRLLGADARGARAPPAARCGLPADHRPARGRPRRILAGHPGPRARAGAREHLPRQPAALPARPRDRRQPADPRRHHGRPWRGRGARGCRRQRGGPRGHRQHGRWRHAGPGRARQRGGSASPRRAWAPWAT